MSSSSFLERNALSIFLAAGVVAVFSVFMFGSNLPAALQGDSASQTAARMPAGTPPNGNAGIVPPNTTAQTNTAPTAQLATAETNNATGQTTTADTAPLTTTNADTSTTKEAELLAATGTANMDATMTNTPANDALKSAAPTADATTDATANTAAMAATTGTTPTPVTPAPVVDNITDTSATGTGMAGTNAITFTPRSISDSELLAAVPARDFSGALLSAPGAATTADDLVVNDLRPAAGNQVTTTPLATDTLASSGPVETALAALAVALLLGVAAHRVFGKQML